MNVLLLHPAMPFSYWSFQELGRLGGFKAMVPPLGLITVAALLPKDWQLRLVDLNTRPLTDRDWEGADLVMLSGMQIQSHNLLALVREAKQRGKRVVAGGPYPTVHPEEVAAAGADYVVRGEAESSLPPFLAALHQGQGRGVFAADSRPDLSLSPLPRFDLLHLNDYGSMGVQTSRGCPFDCEFCDVVNLYGRRPRYKSPSQVLAELAALYRLGWRKPVFICDDNFIGHKDNARAILTGMIPWMAERGEPFHFWTQATVTLGQDLELLDLMTRANFSNVFIGIETPDAEVLSQAHKFHNLRHPLAQSVTTINANGLNVVGSFILGLDGEQPGAGERICQFVEAANLPIVMPNLLQPAPQTRLWDRLQQEGRLVGSDGLGDNLNLHLNYVPTRPQAQIIAEYLEIWDFLYEPSRFLARAARAILAMRPTHQAMSGQPQSSLTNPQKETRTWREHWRNLTAFCRLAWRHGIKAPYRRQFWQQLLQVQRQNPSRLFKYLLLCAHGEDMIRLRHLILARATGAANLEGGQGQPPPVKAAAGR